MLISKAVMMKWNPRNKKRFENLGYTYTHMGDEFEIDVKHLSKGSNTLVKCQCDYCKKIYEKQWTHYLTENTKSFVHKDCCNDCKRYKIQDVSMKKYGVKSVFSNPDTIKKIQNTNMQNLGSKNPFSSDKVKCKIRQTVLKKYGTEYATQSQSVKAKTRATCMDRYGVPSYLYNLHFTGENSPRWKGGVQRHRIERATYQYVEWRNAVYKRDKYICQCCGIKSKKGKAVSLEAHHIYNWKDYEDLRYDVNNGITLCKDCHKQFHKIYGKRNNNKSQIETFLINHDVKVC